MLLLYTSRLTAVCFFPMLMIFHFQFLHSLFLPQQVLAGGLRTYKSYCILQEVRFFCHHDQADPLAYTVATPSPCDFSPSPVVLDGQIFHPSKKLCWLDFLFVSNLASSSHFFLLLALSQASFFSIQRLSDAGKGISPHLCRRLPYCLMFPILSYGADLFTPTKGLLHEMDLHWRQVQRWVTNCFHSTPLSILAAESCLPPLSVLLPHKRRMATLRLISSPMTINPTSARLCRSFPSLLKSRAPHSHQALCKCLAPNIMLLNWKTPLPSPPVRTHLPVDALAHLTVPLLKDLSFAPHINSTLLPNHPFLPSNETITNAYRALRRASADTYDGLIAFPPSSELLHLSPSPLTAPVHGSGKVHGRPHLPDTLSE